MHENELKFEYNEIASQIFLGTTICCQKHFEDELIAKGISADISLESDKVDHPFGVEIFSWIPVEDNGAPTQDQIDLGVDVMRKIIEMNKKVYVHCRFGHGRGPTMVAAYFISKGDSVEEAVKKIKEKRPIIHPNDAQLSALQEFANRLSTANTAS